MKFHEGAVMMKNTEELSTHNEDLNLLEYWKVMKKYRKLILLLVCSLTVLVALVSLFLPNSYKSEAVVMPVGRENNGFAALASQVAGGAALGGLLGMGDSGSQKLVALLKTKVLAERVIEENNLKMVFFKDRWDEKNKKWSDVSNEQITEEAVSLFQSEYFDFEDNQSDGTLKIYAIFEDPELAFRVVSSAIKELQNIINERSLTAEKRNRIFIENQLANGKTRLLEIGKELNSFYQRSNVSSIRSSVDVDLNLTDLSTSSLPNECEGAYDQSVTCLEAKSQLLEERIRAARVVKDVPQQVYLNYLIKQNEFLAQITALLSQQYEMAKIQEVKEDLSFQVIDPAYVPNFRHAPNRRKLVVTAFVLSLFAACGVAFLLDYFSKLKVQSNLD